MRSASELISWSDEMSSLFRPASSGRMRGLGWRQAENSVRYKRLVWFSYASSFAEKRLWWNVIKFCKFLGNSFWMVSTANFVPHQADLIFIIAFTIITAAPPLLTPHPTWTVTNFKSNFKHGIPRCWDCMRRKLYLITSKAENHNICFRQEPSSS